MLIFEQKVFELELSSDKREAYIPYMMNDAVENYLVLKNCRIKGEYLSEYKGEISGEVSQKDSRFFLIIKQGNENTVTIWFDDIEEKKNFYRYHEIGHFWVKENEQWRQLVYMIGTMYDKYLYLGEDSCNQKEIELLPLMEFAPFRFFSPINESLDGEYPDSVEGCEIALKIAKKSGNKKLILGMKLYKRWPLNIFKAYLISLLKRKEGILFYDTIRKLVCEASILYPERDYGEKKNQEIRQARENIQKIMGEKGFFGEYPYFYKDGISIWAVEEHPFTIMETKQYDFRIQYMVSLNEKNYINSGFFYKNGYINDDIKNLCKNL